MRAAVVVSCCAAGLKKQGFHVIHWRCNRADERNNAYLLPSGKYLFKFGSRGFQNTFRPLKIGSKSKMHRILMKTVVSAPKTENRFFVFLSLGEKAGRGSAYNNATFTTRAQHDGHWYG